MRDDMRCDCHICEVERRIFDLLAESPGNIRFLKLAASSPVLAKFADVSELLAYLHSSRTGDYVCSDASQLLTALVDARTTVSDSEVIHSVLVLAFAPTIHRTYREVCTWFRELEPEDIGQQILAFFLELLVSPVAESLVSILPIAVSRSLRKTCFRWAVKEQRTLLKRQDETEGSERAVDATFESVSVLKDFLDYCSRQGFLSRFERELLIKFKIDGFSGKELQNHHTVLPEQSVDLCVHRIIQRPQDAAQALGAKTEQSKCVVQILAAAQRKRRPAMKDFPLKDPADFLPISDRPAMGGSNR